MGVVRQVGQRPTGMDSGGLGANPPGLTQILEKILLRLEGSEGGPAYRKPGACFRCREMGHFKRECPRRPVGGEPGVGVAENGLGQL